MLRGLHLIAGAMSDPLPSESEVSRFYASPPPHRRTTNQPDRAIFSRTTPSGWSSGFRCESRALAIATRLRSVVPIQARDGNLGLNIIASQPPIAGHQ